MKFILKKNIVLLASILLFFAGNFNCFALEKSKSFGGKEGWNCLSEARGIDFGKGRFGLPCVMLETNKAYLSSTTDLLVSFDDGRIVDECGNYSVVENGLLFTEKSIMGNGAFLSRGNELGLRLAAGKNAIFGRKGTIGSFAIEFYLAPSTAENGENVFSWNSSINASTRVFSNKSDLNYAEYQSISASFINSHIEWEFSNIFEGYEDSTVVLRGKNPVVPGLWSKHTVLFDEETGLIEYIVDGRTQDLKFLTETKHEGGTVSPAILGVTADLMLCSNYAGRIDQFRIERDLKKIRSDGNGYGLYATGLETYRLNGGYFATEPAFVSGGATLKSVDAIMNVPPQTQAKLFVRSGENNQNWTSTYPEWKEISSGEEIENVRGMYFQVAAELLPDGSGKYSPSITEVTLNYEEDPLPLPPFKLFAEAGKESGSIKLTWNYSVDDSSGGYYVYYGNRSGEYMGRSAAEGISPVNAGNTTTLTLTGLEKGRIYYFAVASFSKNNGKIMGPLSKEVFARVK